MTPTPPLVFDRRRFLVAGTAAAGVAVLNACGGSAGSGGGAPATADAARSVSLVQFFGGPTFVAGKPFRAPFGVADRDGLLAAEKTPARLEAEVLGPDGKTVGASLVVARHAEGLPRAYFPLQATVDDPGIYTVRTQVRGVAAEMQIEVSAAADVKVIQPGARMPALASPTVKDPRGVTPICTRDPACPLHDLTVAEALAAGSSTALLVASPAFCQIEICGPVLDVLLDVLDAFPKVRFLHAEVYANPEKDLETYAPVVDALGLHFEPCLVLVGPDGSVLDRVDTIFDRSELREHLALLP
ncbi:MAG: hypothetical protein ACT4OV_07005 [Microthrixaceae bacterium]